MEFMYLIFTRMPGESYCRQLMSLLSYPYVSILHERSGPRSVSDFCQAVFDRFDFGQAVLSYFFLLGRLIYFLFNSLPSLC